jgi:hypothetical protein
LEELSGVGACVGFGAGAVLDDEFHLLVAFAPDDDVVFPELSHVDVLLCTPASLQALTPK